jgi:hypothetical protein
MRYLAAVLTTAFLFSCSSADAARPPSPEHPKVGCIAPTLRQSGSHEGKILPEIVIVTGETPIDDGARWIVLRAPDFDPKKWEPHSKEEIVFGARCKAGRDLQEMFDASRGDVEASRPPL